MRIISILIALAIYIPLSAHANTVTAQNPLSIVKEIRILGHEAKLEKDKDGDPLISAKTGTFRWTVYFNQCENGSRCKSILFSASFSAKLAKDVTLARINKWNADNYFGRGYIDEDGDAVIEMDVYSGQNGNSRKDFKDIIVIWDETTSSFSDHIFE